MHNEHWQTGMTKLEDLYLDETTVTNEGIKKLQQALPNRTILHWQPPPVAGRFHLWKVGRLRGFSTSPDFPAPIPNPYSPTV